MQSIHNDFKVFGFKLYSSLKKRKEKIKEMMKKNTYSVDVTPSIENKLLKVSQSQQFGTDSMSTSSSPSSIVPLTGDDQSSSQIQDPALDIEMKLKSQDEKTVPKISESQEKHTSIIIKNDQRNTYKMKKLALRKALSIQVGLSLFFALDFIAFCFLPSAPSWQFSLLFLHMFFNGGQLGFLILILVIYHPLREVQRLFRTTSEENMNFKPTTV